MPTSRSVQERFAPQSACFGCGPANAKGLRIRSFPSPVGVGGVGGEELVAEFLPEAHHEAFPGMLNGGICGALLDCHSNWAAAIHLMATAGTDAPPCTVTANFAVVLKRPTPMGIVLSLRARVVEASVDRACVEATLTAAGKVTATCVGNFVAVRDGHPAFHRW